jgi:hypothetical protein
MLLFVIIIVISVSTTAGMDPIVSMSILLLLFPCRSISAPLVLVLCCVFINDCYHYAIAEAVSRWLPTAAARVRARVSSNVICGGQGSAVAGFLRVLRFLLPKLFIPPTSPSSQLPGAARDLTTS